MKITIPNTVEMTEPLRIYLEEISQIPPLSEVEETELGRKLAAGDLDAKAKLQEGTLHLVVSIAKYYCDKEMAFLDLIQEGNIGLMYAAEQFEHEEGRLFSKYASLYIEEAMQTAIEEETAEIERILELMKKSVPEDAPIDVADEDGAQEDDETDASEVAIASLIQKEEVEKLLTNLTEVEKQVISMRFGLYGDKVCTSEAIAAKLNMTEDKVLSIEAEAMQALKTAAIQEDSNN